MALFETPDGQEVTDKDYVVVLDRNGSPVDARKFVKNSSGNVNFEPVAKNDDFPYGHFRDAEWMKETYEEQYPPERYEYQVRSSITEKIKTKLGQ